MYFYIMSIREYLSSAKKSRYLYGKYSVFNIFLYFISIQNYDIERMK